ncbi:MAG: hypothetical protein NWE79_03595 [Candidatus Bathyarchaeota archaeon]|nr:hypothetical protein [Candidatus Bathyarchaeota archaeon]
MRRTQSSAPDEYSEKKLRELEEKLGICFQNQNLLVTALSHRSSEGDPRFSKAENKRLGLVGASVLDLVLFEHLYNKCQLTRERMDNVRQDLTNNEKLAQIGREMGIKKHLFLPKSVGESTLEESVSIFADSLEALIGAIYLDQGLEKARSFVEKKGLMLFT